MKAGEINKGAVILLLVFVVGAAGYLWYKQLYTPAVAARVAAKAQADSAQQELQAAQADLQRAQDTLAQQKSAAGKPDDAVSRLQLASQAVPNKPRIDEAALVLEHLAKRSGISTSINVGGDSAGTVSGSGAGGSTPIDITFKAAGTYAEMQSFMDQVQGTVTLDDGKLHARGRLFNVVSLQLGAPDKPGSGGAQANPAAGDPSAASGDDLEIGPFDIQFTVVVRAYTSTTDNANAAGAALPTGDPGAANGATNSTTNPSGTSGTPGTSTATTDSPATGAATNTASPTGGATDSTAPGGTATGAAPSSTSTTTAGGQ